MAKIYKITKITNQYTTVKLGNLFPIFSATYLEILVELT
jgi:hypothetical protein